MILNSMQKIVVAVITKTVSNELQLRGRQPTSNVELFELYETACEAILRAPPADAVGWIEDFLSGFLASKAIELDLS